LLERNNLAAESVQDPKLLGLCQTCQGILAIARLPSSRKNQAGKENETKAEYSRVKAIHGSRATLGQGREHVTWEVGATVEAEERRHGTNHKQHADMNIEDNKQTTEGTEKKKIRKQDNALTRLDQFQGQKRGFRS
jgi:hypothetical protein